MAPRLGFWKRTRWLWPTLVLPWVPMMVMAGPLEPWVAPKLGYWVEGLPMIGLLALACAVGAIGEPIQRRDRTIAPATILALFVQGALLYQNFTLADVSLRQWTRFFDACRPEREAAVKWFRALPLEDDRVFDSNAPQEVRRLVAGTGRILVKRDHQGRRWLGLGIVSYGIDNDKVFLWSESGEKPPEEAYPVVVKSWPMGGGWWFAVTT